MLAKDHDELVQEIERLRRSLEAALLENAQLVEDNGRLRSQAGQPGGDVCLNQQPADTDPDGAQESPSSLRGIADIVPDVLWRTDASGRANWFNQRWFAYTGQDEAGAVETGWLDVIHPDDRSSVRDAWAAAVEQGRPYQYEERIRRSDGEYRWFLIRAEPRCDEHGHIGCWFGSGTDIHERRMATEALQRSEARFRTLLEGMPQLVWRAVEGGLWTWSSSQWSNYTGQPASDAIGTGWLEMLHPEDRDLALAAWGEAQHSRELDMGARIFHSSEQRYRHFRTRALPLWDSDGQVSEWLGTSTDVDDLLQLQREQSVLVAELQHRTRNLMAMVRTVTRRTIQQATSFDTFAERIDDRLSALARVQTLLSRREAATRLHFDVLLREEISAHVELDTEGQGRQVTLEGAAGIALRSSCAQTFALALHELATNAVKYGALSQPAGHLRIAWGTRSDAKGKWLCVDWRETGVVGMPDRHAAAKGGGYGRELIERALPYQLEARTMFAFEPDGVHCTIELPLPASDDIVGDG
jgi:PAS domain S-box-containing protein